ncbi:uncharacterized protein BDW43DRAFT_316058 [Aspergillus alliaceus]|uniref:uncharacterized protein n=1 Tax=Petromyces alliaceus TaxID=209559 RepID=UPI0012A641C5|nr:uncharacterized protein BDW43DRAFT_316058 [Aspergillus alliaceus]KAB8228315.1 hypothetical protein BDW43DRAFT_316058 [Aspergillus alliaceus]
MSLLDCRALAESVHHVQATLENLELHINIYSEYAEKVEYISIYPVTGHLPLRELTNLRRLKVPLVMLFGWFPEEAPSMAEALPVSLTHPYLTEDLRMQCTYEWREELVLAKLGEYYKNIKEAAPALEVFEFKPNRYDDQWGEDLEERLSAVCGEAGIQYIIH